MEERKKELEVTIIEKKDESPLIVKMRKKTIYFASIALMFGLLFDLCYYDFYRPYSGTGIVFPILVIGSYGILYLAVYGLGIPFQKKSVPLVIMAALLGISTVRTGSSFLHNFNFLGAAMLFTICVIQQFYREKDWGIGRYLKNSCSLWLFPLLSSMDLFKHIKAINSESNKEKSKNIQGIFLGIVIAVPLMFLILLLLSGADMVFSSLVDYIFSGWFFTPEPYQHLIVTGFGFFAFYGLLSGLTRLKLDDGISVKTEKDPTPAVIVTSVIGISYFIFCGIQILFLFGGGLFQLPEGITYSEYAREGFFQLLGIVVLNIILVLVTIHICKKTGVLKYLLAFICGCTFIMIISAAYRMCLYVEVYHLSFLRILVLWFLGVLTVLMGGVIYYVFHSEFRIFPFGFMVIMIGYILLSLARPDYIAAKYNISSAEQMAEQDYYYLIHLSDDAIPVILSTDRGRELFKKYKLKEERKTPSGFRYFNLSRLKAEEIISQIE